MILASTLKVLAKQCPGYRLVSPGIARNSISICTCPKCRFAHEELGHLLCSRVMGRLDDDGYAIVASNGSCDRAEFRKEDPDDFKLTDK